MSDADGTGAPITDLDGVKRYFMLDVAESPVALVEVVRDSTACGIVLEIEPDGILLSGMIEDSEAIVNRRWLSYPFTAEDLTAVIEEIEEQVSLLGDIDRGGRLAVDIIVKPHPMGDSETYVMQIVAGPAGYQLAGHLDDLHRIVSNMHAAIHARLREAGRPVRKDELDETPDQDEEEAPLA